MKGLELKDKGIEYFTQEKLENLSKTHDERLVYQPVNSRRYAAFPWMVDELKPESGSEKQCIRQAANATLSILA